jgi:hypothetical protein
VAAVKDDNTSGARTTVYLFGLSVIGLVAYYVDAELHEVALWQTALGAAIPAGALLLATVRAWPKRKKHDADG